MASLRSIWLPVLMTTLICQTVFYELIDATPSTRTNPSEPLLKEQTPIENTNLFVNTPYKWHDNTKPGCYATWLTEMLEGKELKAVTMVCSRDDQQWYNTSHAVWIFEGYGERDGKFESVKIKNIGAGAYVDMSYFTSESVVRLYLSTSQLVKFCFHSDRENINRVELYLWPIPVYTSVRQQPKANHRAVLFYEPRIDQPTDFYNSFYPAIKLDARMYDFVFTPPMEGEIAQHSSKKDLIDSYDIGNDSPATLSRTIKVSEKITNEFAWGLSESLKAFAKVTGSAGIPFIAEGKVEAGIELNFGADQNWKNSEEKLFEMSYDVSVPPYSNVRVSAWYQLIKDISIEYTARTEITGTTSRVTMFDDIVNDARATGEMIRRHLDFLRFDGTVVEIKKYSVITQIKGTMVASVGFRGQLSVGGRTVAANL